MNRVHGGTRPNILAVKAVTVLCLLLVVLLVGHVHVIQADLALMTFAANIVVRLHEIVILLRAGQVLRFLFVHFLRVGADAEAGGGAAANAALPVLTFAGRHLAIITA